MTEKQIKTAMASIATELRILKRNRQIESSSNLRLVKFNRYGASIWNVNVEAKDAELLRIQCDEDGEVEKVE